MNLLLTFEIIRPLRRYLLMLKVGHCKRHQVTVEEPRYQLEFSVEQIQMAGECRTSQSME